MCPAVRNDENIMSRLDNADTSARIPAFHGFCYFVIFLDDYLSIDDKSRPKAEKLVRVAVCERLSGELLEIAELPEDNDMRVMNGDTKKCVYRFEL